MNTRKSFLVLLLASWLAVNLSPVQRAQAADSIGVIDQSNIVPARLFDSIQWFSPIGQSFTPSIACLDTIEMWTEDFTWSNGNGVGLYVNIRETTIYGPILGTSHVLQLPDNFSGLTHFTFPSLISMTPGRVYVIEVVALGGEEWIVYYNWGLGSGGGPESTYPGGTWILNGIEVPNNDLWFREGLASQSPQTSAYCKNGVWSYLSRADGSSFKNQGDCIQYVLTGK